MSAEPSPQTQAQLDGPAEPEALLCLGGPKHNKSIAWRGENFEYRERGTLHVHRYRWVKLALNQGEVGLVKSLYVHDGEDA